MLCFKLFIVTSHGLTQQCCLDDFETWSNAGCRARDVTESAVMCECVMAVGYALFGRYEVSHSVTRRSVLPASHGAPCYQCRSIVTVSSCSETFKTLECSARCMRCVCEEKNTIYCD